QVGREVQQVLGRILRHPEPRQIDFSIRRALSGRIQIDLAIGRARYPLPRIGVPLGAGHHGEGEHYRRSLEGSDHFGSPLYFNSILILSSSVAPTFRTA